VRLQEGVGPLSGVSISRLNGVGALWDCVSRVCGGRGSCADGDVPLGAVLVLSWCVWGGVSRGYTDHHHRVGGRACGKGARAGGVSQTGEYRKGGGG